MEGLTKDDLQAIKRQAYADGYKSGMRESKTWTLVLSKYQRDNLLGFFRWCRSYEKHFYAEAAGVEPFTLADTGDWFGEIYWMLFNSRLDRQEDELPNVTVAEMQQRVDAWVKKKTHDG